MLSFYKKIAAILAIIACRIYKSIYHWLSRIMLALRVLPSFIGEASRKDIVPLDESFEIAGYAYDPRQDIFYSVPEPWQRSFGYCRLYDEAAAPLGMIIDCEPVYFEYDGKKWLIELWKGQYDLATGCEAGVYTTKGPDLNIPGVFNGTFYECAGEADFLSMSYSFKKHGRTLFVRKGRQWWLTGFKLGEFSEPSDLSMFVNITLKDRVMRNAFVNGLKSAGYSEQEFMAYRNSVSLLFGRPHTPQPFTRTKATDALMQMKNKLLCDQYQELIRGCLTIQDKLKAVEERAPEMYGHIAGLGKSKQLFSLYETVRKHL